jgi:hypothetical protein
MEILDSIMQATFHLQIYKTKFTKPKWYDNQIIRENWHNGEIGSFTISLNAPQHEIFPLQIHKIKILKPKWYDNGNAMQQHVYQLSLGFFSH